MAFKEGDRIRIKARPVTEEDTKKGTYYNHMAGLTGVIQNAYSDNQYAVNVDASVLQGVNKTVLDVATTTLRAKFLENSTEEQRKLLTNDELNFGIHYMLLVQEADLEKV